MTIREYLKTYELLTTAQITGFNPWLTADMYETLKNLIKHAYGAREMYFCVDDDTLESEVQAIVKSWYDANEYKFSHLFGSINAEYNLLDSKKTIIDHDSTDTLEHGLKVEYQPDTVNIEAERTNDSQAFTDIKKSYSTDKDTTTNSGTDTRTLVKDETITEQMEPQDAIERERRAAEFVYLQTMAADLVNFLCLSGWEV